MNNNSRCSTIEECMEQVKKNVYVEENTLRKIISLFYAIKNKKFPSNKLPRGIIFYGPPGTGKTLLMRTLKEVMDIPVVYIHGPEIMSEYYGKTEENLRRKFKKAEYMAERSNLSIIFIDELDSIAPNRRNVSGELEQRTVGQLLTLMDGLSKETSNKGHVMVIASTNRIEDIDPALRRPGRFDLEFEFDLPDKEGRREILKILLKQVSNKVDFDPVIIDEIAENTYGFSGADLQHLINEAILESLVKKKRGRGVSSEDLKNSIPKVIPSAMRGYRIMDGKKSNNREIIRKSEEIYKKLGGNIDNFTIVKIVGRGHEVYEKGYEIASTLSCIIKSQRCRFIEMDAIEFMVKWFGETERRIIEFFNKIKRLQPCILYMPNVQVLTSSNNDKPIGAKYALLKQLLDMKNINSKVMLIFPIPQDTAMDSTIDGFIESYFKNYIINL